MVSHGAYLTVLCPLTEEPCTYSGRRRLTECFVDKFRKKYYNIPELEYTAQEIEKYIRHGVYTIRDLRHSIMKILTDSREDVQVLKAELCGFFDTFPCKLALLTLLLREITKLDTDFLHHMNFLYKSGGAGLRSFIKIAIQYPIHKINVLTSLVFETCTTLADLQLSSSLSTLLKLLEESQRTYIAWSLLLQPLYLLYLDYKSRNELSVLDVDLEALSESFKEELNRSITEIVYLEYERAPVEKLYALLQIPHEIIRKLMRGTRLNIVVSRSIDRAHSYAKLKSMINEYGKELRELLSSVEPRCLLSPFSIYVMLGTYIEYKKLLNIDRDSICKQYLSDEYNYTFRMYMPINAVLDDLMTKLCAELMLTRQEYLFKYLICSDGNLYALTEIADVKEMPLKPSSSIIPPTLMAITFIYSSILDVLSWLFDMADEDLWNLRLTLTKDESRRRFLISFKTFVVDELNEVTDLMYDVLKVFYVDDKCESYYIELLERVRKMCEGSTKVE